VASFQQRLTGALRLQAAAFEDVEHDPAATVQALVVVTVAHVSQALAGVGLMSVRMFVLSIAAGLIGWAIGAGVLLFVGTRWFPGKDTEADFGQLLRTLGFAQAAGLLGVFGLLPRVGWLVFIVVSVWILVAMVVAVRQALDYEETSRAILVCGVAWLIMLAIQLAAAVLGVGVAVLSNPVA
jgi:hypothetical protein